jgi:hypothetical protein
MSLVSKIVAEKPKFECSISFRVNKNLKKIFHEKKFLRIITLNNMLEGKNNIFIIRDNDDVEASIENLELECLAEGKSKENNLILTEKIKELEQENKELKSKLLKLKKILD